MTCVAPCLRFELLNIGTQSSSSVASAAPFSIVFDLIHGHNNCFHKDAIKSFGCHPFKFPFFSISSTQYCRLDGIR